MTSEPRREIALYAEFTAKAGAEPEVAQLIADLGRQVRALEGTVLFEVWRLRDRPRHFVVFEVYADQASFDRQLESDHNRRFNARIGALIEEPETQLTWLGERVA